MPPRRRQELEDEESPSVIAQTGAWTLGLENQRGIWTSYSKKPKYVNALFRNGWGGGDHTSVALTNSV